MIRRPNRVPGEPIVRDERTGFRDMALSRLHRRWGYDCPATDIDFLEFHRGRAVALIELKHETADEVDIEHPTMRAIRDLGVRAGVPVYLVRYADDFSWWDVTPIDEIAKREIDGFSAFRERVKWEPLADGIPIRMREADYVRLLYWLRRILISDSRWAALTEHKTS